MKIHAKSVEEMCKIQPGPELDALIAEKVMGWKLKHLKEGHVFNGEKQKLDGCFHLKGPNGEFKAEFLAERRYSPYNGKEREGYPWCIAYNHIPKYSTSIAAAWEVVEKIESDDVDFPLNIKLNNYGDGWTCQMWNTNRELHISITAETAPHAICLAALKAVGE